MSEKKKLTYAQELRALGTPYTEDDYDSKLKILLSSRITKTSLKHKALDNLFYVSIYATHPNFEGVREIVNDHMYNEFPQDSGLELAIKQIPTALNPHKISIEVSW